MRNWAKTAAAALSVLRICSAYDIVREYSGSSFFDRWDFYGSWDNLTNGDVWWLDRVNATQQQLAYVNTDGNAIIRVDDTSVVPYNEKRNSIRITTTDSYNYGSLIIIDILHLPFGCSVWPAFWTKGETWPDDGEIDIIEAINLMTSNQMALHTTAGCYHDTPTGQIGQSTGLGPGNVGGTGLNSDGEDATDCSTPSGCVVTETKANSFGSSFAENGGGVWAMQFDIAGVYIWFWPRGEVPVSIEESTSTSSMDLSDWGSPSAAYPNSSCTFEDFFTPQQLVMDITLCGDWAGLAAVYNATCGSSGPTGICYTNNVVGNGSNYADAYFEVSHIRAYTTGVEGIAPTAAFAQTPITTSGAQLTYSHPISGRSEWVAMAWVTLILCMLFGTVVVL
ncbi:glycoside hydrolase family 16 [Pyrrhoderma noxium]|uniref:Glycoside hydrolase family 16 n=1 Tax=Pyrrhoderma noxium TaxID=2282107 RepID=A0A286ULU0_9AGAM|nr:glycoside hydrolase family 16 [Pyrrhoderma noxium]